MTTPTLQPDTGWMGDRSRGASMGRPAHGKSETKDACKFYLRRIRINSGGYDAGGAYWGLGAPLWWAVTYDLDEGREVDRWFRATDRAAARAEVRKLFPQATFYR